MGPDSVEPEAGPLCVSDGADDVGGILDRSSCGVDDQMITVPWLVVAFQDLRPGGWYQIGNINVASFCAPAVFGVVGADELDFEHDGTVIDADSTPGVTCEVERIHTLDDDADAVAKLFGGEAVPDGVAD